MRNTLQRYEMECAKKGVIPEIKLTQTTEADIQHMCQYVMHAQGLMTEGPEHRNWAERWFLYYPAMLGGTVVGIFDDILCFIPGYRKNVKAGFSAGLAFGHFVAQTIYEKAKSVVTKTYDNVKGSMQGISEKLQVRKKEAAQPVAVANTPAVAPASNIETGEFAIPEGAIPNIF